MKFVKSLSGQAESRLPAKEEKIEKNGKEKSKSKKEEIVSSCTDKPFSFWRAFLFALFYLFFSAKIEVVLQNNVFFK